MKKNVCVCVCVCIYISPYIYISRQEYWSGLPLLSLGDLLNPGIEPRSPELQAGPLLSGLGLGLSWWSQSQYCLEKKN